MAQISAKTKAHPEVVTVEYDMPTDLAGLVGKFGEEAVFSAAEASFTITLQNIIRANIEDAATAQTAVNEFVPGARKPRSKKSTLDKVSESLSKLSPEEQKELLARIKALRAAT